MHYIPFYKKCNYQSKANNVSRKQYLKQLRIIIYNISLFVNLGHSD